MLHHKHIVGWTLLFSFVLGGMLTLLQKHSVFAYSIQSFTYSSVFTQKFHREGLFDGDMFYMPNQSNVAALQYTISGSVATEIPVPINDLQASPVLVGNSLYVAGYGSTELAVINTSTHAVQTYGLSGVTMAGLTYANDRVFVSHLGGSDVIDVVQVNDPNDITDEVVNGEPNTPIALPAESYVEPLNDAGLLYYPLSNGDLFIVDIATFATTTIPSPSGATFAAPGVMVNVGGVRYMYIPSSDGIQVYNLDTQTHVAQIGAGRYSESKPTVFDNGSNIYLYIPTRNDEGVIRIDTSTNVDTFIPLTGAIIDSSGFMVDNVYFIPDSTSKELIAIQDTSVIGTIPLGFQVDSALSYKNGYVYLASSDQDQIYVLSLHPQLMEFRSTSPDGTYNSGEVINVTANFDEPLLPGSSLTVQLDTGAVVTLNTIVGNSLVGNYTVGYGESTLDLKVSQVQSSMVLGNFVTSTSIVMPTHPTANIDFLSDIVISATTPGVTNIHIESDNADASLARQGDNITLSFEVDAPVTSSTIRVARELITPTCLGTGPYQCTATLSVSTSTPVEEAYVDISIIVESSGFPSIEYVETTDGSVVMIDRLLNSSIVWPLNLGMVTTSYPVFSGVVTSKACSREIGTGPDVSYLDYGQTIIAIPGDGMETTEVSGTVMAIDWFEGLTQVATRPHTVTIEDIGHGYVFEYLTPQMITGNRMDANHFQYTISASTSNPILPYESPCRMPDFLQGPTEATRNNFYNLAASVVLGDDLGSADISYRYIRFNTSTESGVAEVYSSSTLLCSSAIDVDGSWSCTSLTSLDGPVTVDVITTDQAGNSHWETRSFTVSLPIATGGGGSGVPVIYGCLDRAAVNYAPNATLPAECKYTTVIELPPRIDSPGLIQEVLPKSVTEAPAAVAQNTERCEPYINSYFKKGQQLSASEVEKLQRFLNEFEGETLSLTRDYDDATEAAIIRFQEKYAKDVLAFWNIKKGTGYVYLTTKNKINALVCAVQKPALNCPYFSYTTPQMKSDEIKKIQEFMKKNVDTSLNVNGRMDDATRNAISLYQQKNRSSVLIPWSYREPTGLVYQTTRKQMHRDIGCFEGPVRLPNGRIVE